MKSQQSARELVEKIVIEEISRLVVANVLSPTMGIRVYEVLKAEFTTATVQALASGQLTLCIYAPVNNGAAIALL